ncbi:hypothetical protein [Pseudomonas sp. NBRC 111139]|uniref:hypothetical protein n=1 Tax=Pseudomonas sp. NBRC 111139 TaxID=1661054 RepID=UPI000A8F62AA|nr:hypothetical protein [Pseudomonas sp. NBRC 111139]
MGTSTSSKGPGGNSPYIPGWVDSEGQPPTHEVPPQRFKDFRTNLGKFVASGDGGYLRSAVSSYAGAATGGSAIGAARFGSMAGAGGALFGAMAALREGQSLPGLDLAALNGQDTDLAISAIVEALATEDGDSDRVHVAMNEALSECLQGYDEFDFSSITDEMLVQMMLVYVTNCVFSQVVLDSNDAFAKTKSAAQVEQAERDLHTLVESVTDKHMRPLLSGNLKSFTSSRVEQVQLMAIKEVWREWESYNQ